MRARPFKACLAALLAAGGLSVAALLSAQEPARPAPPTPYPETPAAADKGDDPPPVPKGVEVLTRGPVHEAFATPTDEPQPTTPVAKKPPKPLEELPPDQKPEGDVQWIGGYWAWDEERNDYLWVSGVWRTAPAGRQWVAGYWREDGDKWQWVPGFWQAAPKEAAKNDVTYLPKPPDPPDTAPPGEAPNAESFYTPGHYEWRGDAYVWRAGYWARVQPGYVWVPSHFRWTPYGYVYVAGYWDLTVARRGVIYAPVVVDAAVVPAGFVYTPSYVVADTVVVDAFFVRPCYCHYYFGDYYGPVYRDRGYVSVVVYSRRHYDSIIVYERYEHRRDPHWERAQVELCLARHEGRAPCPPRTLAEQARVVGHGTVVVAPASRVAAERGMRMEHIDNAARVRAREQATAVHQAAAERRLTEAKTPPAGQSNAPHVATLPVSRTGAAATAARPSGLAPPPGSATQAGTTAPRTGQAATQPTKPLTGNKPLPTKPAPPSKPPPPKHEPPKHQQGDGH